MTDVGVGVRPERGRFRQALVDIYHEHTNFNFLGRVWRWALLSGSLLLISVIALAASGLNLGIDFDGGLSWDVRVTGHTPSVGTVRDAVTAAGLKDPKISIRQDRSTGQNHVVVQGKDVAKAKQAQITKTLSKYGEIAGTTSVSATFGSTVTNKALIALGVFFAVIAVYLSFRFEPKMAVAAISAVLHDILLTVGVYAVTGFEVVPATVVAFLTILGFSLYDTVVVFDKIKENVPTIGSERGDTYTKMANRSLNQVLMRSLNTSFVALLPVASLLIVGSYVFGADTLKDFALALFVGLLTGAYSSIFVATPILAWLKEREPRFVALRERSATQLARDAVLVPGPAPAPVPARAAASRRAVALSEERPVATVPAEPELDELDDITPPAAPASPARAPVRPTRAPSVGGSVAPRPRQQRRRKRR